MTRCSVCNQLVIINSDGTRSGQFTHDECLHGAQRTQRAAKTIGPRSRLEEHVSLPRPRRGPSGIGAGVEPRVVLFVAADEDALLTYDALAKVARFESELARDGYEAILLAYLARPDAVVLDLRDARVDAGSVLNRFDSGVYTRSLPMVLVGPAPTEAVGRRPEDGRQSHTVHGTDPFDVLRAVETIFDEARRPVAVG